MIHRESALQRGVKRFVRRAVALPHIFAAHDRSAEHDTGSHLFETERGIVPGWPDTVTITPGLHFYAELKTPGKRPTQQQARVGASLNAMPGCAWAWADTVTGFALLAEAARVPLLPNWRTVAAHEDELVAADIRKQEAKQAGLVPRGKAPRGKAPRAKRNAGNPAWVGRARRAGVMI
jgi:hypothetical protein